MDLNFPPEQYPRTRPTRDEAMSAIFATILNIRASFKMLEEIFVRENDYRLRQQLHKSRKNSNQYRVSVSG